VSELQAAREDEYGEVLDRVPGFLEEPHSERDHDRAAYDEVEESEADLERIRARLAKIDRRDYFGAPAERRPTPRLSAAPGHLRRLRPRPSPATRSWLVSARACARLRTA
jgi:hypothetical protein